MGKAGWIPAQGTKGKAPIACVVSGFATVLQRRTMICPQLNSYHNAGLRFASQPTDL